MLNLSGAAKLQGDLKKLRVAWAEVEAGWKDVVRHDFERKHIDPLEAQVRATVVEIQQLAEVFDKARKEIRP